VSNRHNIGFLCLGHFARTQGIRFDRKQGRARVGLGEVLGIKVVLARPQTYMNQSGQSVSLLISRFDIDLDDLLVIYDDLDLPLGKMRLRRGGGSGGHKGVDSIISCLGSQDFFRLRVGISRPETASDEAEIINYVLSNFTPEEQQIIAQVIPRVSEAILCLLGQGLANAMNKYN
jgi:PTH1 family peptidyl-tRNA hydrolase